MKDSINHALLACGQLERDIARICASGNEAQQGLAADCAEHRRQLSNKLRMIQYLNPSIIPSTPEQSAELYKLIAATNSAESRDRYEASAKAGDINELSDDGYTAERIRRENVELWRSYDRKKNWLGWGLAALAIGGIIAIVEIVATIYG